MMERPLQNLKVSREFNRYLDAFHLNHMSLERGVLKSKSWNSKSELCFLESSFHFVIQGQKSPKPSCPDDALQIPLDSGSAAAI